jgi:DNA-binding beta-propeller fold protein YncE
MMLDRREFLAMGLAAAPALAGWSARGAPAPLALVTADAEAHVAVVSLAGMRVVQRLATVGDPRSIERAPGGGAVVGHASSGAISLLAGRPLHVRRVLRGFGAPRYTAVRRDRDLAYVSDSGHGEIAVVDLAAGRVLRRVAVGDGARHLTLRPDGAELWVALGSSAAEIAVLDVRDPERPRLRGRVRPPFLVHDVGFSPSGRRVWVTAGREPRMPSTARAIPCACSARTPRRSTSPSAARSPTSPAATPGPSPSTRSPTPHSGAARASQSARTTSSGPVGAS